MTENPSSPATSPAPKSQTVSNYLRTWTTLPDSWLILGRNLIPVAGVAFFGWSVALTSFNYWFDGVSSLAAMIGVVLFSGLTASNRERNLPLLPVIMMWFMLMGIVFGICAIPYWLLLNSHLGVLQLDVVGKQFDRTPSLWLTFIAIVIANFWNAVRAGYAGMANDQLKARFGAQFWALLIRAGAMLVITHLGSAALIVPMMALVLTALETQPLVRERMQGSVGRVLDAPSANSTGGG
jgi:hypothetical protein